MVAHLLNMMKQMIYMNALVAKVLFFLSQKIKHVEILERLVYLIVAEKLKI